MKRKIFSILIASVFLSGCSSNIESGIVVNKYYEDDYTYVTCIPVGKTIIPITHYMPDSYKIEIRSEYPDSDGEYETAVIEVSAEEYNDIEIGDEWKE